MMPAWRRVAPVALALVLALTFLSGCAGGDTPEADTADTEAIEPGESSSAESEPAAEESEAAETEVANRPPDFPADVPLHPGAVTVYEPMQVTDTTTVHQLTIESAASFDDVVRWYETQLPAGWSVGYSEIEDEDSGREAKIALNGGSYTPASEEGLGGGVLVGVFENEPTVIVTTVTVIGAP